MTLLSILIEKGSSVLKMRWYLPTFAFKKLFEHNSKNNLPTSSSLCRVTSIFPEHNTECYHLRNP